jgi:hypothetical protein
MKLEGANSWATRTKTPGKESVSLLDAKVKGKDDSQGPGLSCLYLNHIVTVWLHCWAREETGYHPTPGERGSCPLTWGKVKRESPFQG